MQDVRERKAVEDEIGVRETGRRMDAWPDACLLNGDQHRKAEVEDLRIAEISDTPRKKQSQARCRGTR